MRQRSVLARRVRSNLPAAAWDQVTDPRDPRGIRHRLEGLLQLLVLGFAAGSRTLRDVEELGKNLWNRRDFKLREGPSDTTLDRTVRMVDATELGEVLSSQVWAMHRSKQLPVRPEVGVSLVAIDGKRFGTSRTAEHPDVIAGGGEDNRYYQVHALRAVHVASDVKPVLGQRVVEHSEHEGEGGAFWPFLEWLLAHYGSLVEAVSMDAGFTSWRTLTRMNAIGVGFLAALKGNTERVHAWAQEQLGAEDVDPPRGWEKAETERVRRARQITRSFARVSGKGLSSLGWQGVVSEVWRIRQVTQRDGQRVVEDRYFLTNFPGKRLSAAQAMTAIRSHWGIENDCNWTLDMQLYEDTETWVAKGRASEVLAMLRLIAYNLLRLCRHRALRSEENRAVPWRTLLCWMRDALVSPSPVWEPDGIG